jgi:hypothetical protein
MSSKPINKEGFDRIKEHLSKSYIISKIDFLCAMNMEIGLAYYHGGRVRAGWKMMREGIRLNVSGFYWSCVFRFCDKVGWTRLQLIPGTPYFERHSGKCEKMNCADCDCVSSGIPKWFQRLTRMRDDR